MSDTPNLGPDALAWIKENCSEAKDPRDMAIARLTARIAELEGAATKYCEQVKDLQQERTRTRQEHERAMRDQAAELERLRGLERSIRVASRDSSALDELDARVLAALEELDRAPAQAEPQDGRVIPDDGTVHVHRFAPALLPSQNWRPGHKYGPCFDCQCEKWDDGLITRHGKPIDHRPVDREGGER